MATVNISDYSGDVVSGNWAPAVAAAFTDLSSQGGTIVFDTDITLKSETTFVQIGNEVAWNLVGDGGHTIKIDMPVLDIAFRMGACTKVTLKNLNFIGDTGTGSTADCNAILYTPSTEDVIVENCLFAGILATTSIISAGFGGTNLLVKNCKFGGCGGPWGILFTDGNSLRVEQTQMFDYQHYLGDYYDRQAGRSYWIKATTATPLLVAGNPYIDINGFVGDEGAGGYIWIENFDDVTIRNGRSNLFSTNGKGIKLDGVAKAKIENCWMGFATNPGQAAILTNCGSVKIDGLKVTSAAHYVEVDSNTDLTVVNSPTVTVNHV